MNLKYFYYISKTKVDMLYAQVQRKQFYLPKISPKVEFAGFSIGADLEYQSRQDLIERTLSLMEAMNKKKMVKPLANNTKLETSRFYQDESNWHNGLYSFYAAPGIEMVVYFLWRVWEDSIILLAGSPLNVLGEKVIRGGLSPVLTCNVWDELTNFVQRNFQTDEVNFVGMNTKYSSVSQKLSQSNLPGELEQTRGNIPLIRVNQEWYVSVLRGQILQSGAPGMVENAIYNGDSLRALDLGVFCITCLRKLPQNNISTVFKIFRKVEIDRPKELPSWIEQLKRTSLNEQIHDLEKCRRVYIGSPIYVILS